MSRVYEFTIKGKIESDDDDLGKNETALGTFIDDLKLIDQTIGVPNNNEVDFVSFSLSEDTSVVDFKEYHEQ